MKTLYRHIPIALATAATLFNMPSESLADDATPWALKGSLVLVDADETFSVDKPTGGELFAGGVEVGALFALEYRHSRHLGFEIGIGYAKTPDIDEELDNGDTVGEGPEFVPVLAGLNFHLTDTDKLDVYIGPRAAYVNFGSFDLELDGESTSYDVDNDFAWGAAAGLSYRFNESRWSVIAEVTYLDVDMKITEAGSNTSTISEYDPLILNVGATYRF